MATVRRKMYCILLFIAQFTVVINGKMRYPLFSWDRVPTYIHMCNRSGPFNDEANKRLATFPIVTIEKGQGDLSNGTLPLNYSSQYEEAKIIEACKAVKLINDSIICIFYLNTMLDFNNYYLHIEMVENPSYRLRDDKGAVVYQHGGGPLVNQPPGGYWVFDFQQEIVQNFYISECINASKSKYVDGCFYDRSNDNSFGSNYSFSKDTLNKFKTGHNNVLYKTQQQLNNSDESILIDNQAQYVNGMAATQMEDFVAGQDTLNQLMTLANKGIVVEAHVYGQNAADNTCNDITNSLSCFLIGAQKYSYYACSTGWIYDAWKDHKEYHKPLGKPLGNFVLNGDQYERNFTGDGKNKVMVQWNRKTLVGKITWSDGTRQIGKNGSPV